MRNQRNILQISSGRRVIVLCSYRSIHLLRQIRRYYRLNGRVQFFILSSVDCGSSITGCTFLYWEMNSSYLVMMSGPNTLSIKRTSFCWLFYWWWSTNSTILLLYSWFKVSLTSAKAELASSIYKFNYCPFYAKCFCINLFLISSQSILLNFMFYFRIRGEIFSANVDFPLPGSSSG